MLGLAPEPLDHAFAAVVHGVGSGGHVFPDCLAVPRDPPADGPVGCSVVAHEGPACKVHDPTDDFELVADAHQWATIEAHTDDHAITVCVRCEAVWRGPDPTLAVGCPTCDAPAGLPCGHHYRGPGAASCPARRERARAEVADLAPCPDAPATTDSTAELVADGGRPTTTAGPDGRTGFRDLGPDTMSETTSPDDATDAQPADAAPEWLDQDALPNASDLRRFAVYAQHGDGPALHVATGTLHPDGHVTARVADGTPPSSFVDVATLRRMCQMAVAGDAYASVDVWLDFEDPEWGDTSPAAGATTPASGRGPDEVWRDRRERRREVHGGDHR